MSLAPAALATNAVSNGMSRAMVPQERLSVVNAAYALGIVLVVAGHSFPSARFTGDVKTAANPIFDWIYSFHMPLYFFLAGVTFQCSETRQPGRPIGRYLYDRCVRLLVPYVVLNSLGWPLRVVMSAFAPHKLVRSADFSLSFSNYFHSMLYPWKCAVTYLWFLPTLFLVSVTGLGLSRLFRRHEGRLRTSGAWAVLVLACAASLMIPHRDVDVGDTIVNWTGAVHYFFYYWMGSVVSEYGLLRSLQTLPAPAVIFSSAIVLTAQSILVAWGRVTNHNESPLVILTLGILGACMAMLLAKVIDIFAPASVVRMLSQYGYQMYLMSWFIQVPTMIVASTFLKLPLYIATAASFGSGLLGSVGIAMWLGARPAYRVVWMGFEPRGSTSAEWERGFCMDRPAH